MNKHHCSTRTWVRTKKKKTKTKKRKKCKYDQKNLVSGRCAAAHQHFPTQRMNGNEEKYEFPLLRQHVVWIEKLLCIIIWVTQSSFLFQLAFYDHPCLVKIWSSLSQQIQGNEDTADVLPCIFFFSSEFALASCAIDSLIGTHRHLNDPGWETRRR